MKIPFTYEQFVEVFKNYNESVFPVQIIMYLVIVAFVFFLLMNSQWASKSITLSLIFFWLWMGIIYHIAFFSTINNAAFFFGSLFILQGFLFAAFIRRLSFRFTFGSYGMVGLALILYALILYPILGLVIGHVYPSAPTFGLPCPTTIFTFGIFLITDKKVPVVLLIIPFLWALIGTSAAFSLGFYEDIGLLIAAITSSTMILMRNKKLR